MVVVVAVTVIPVFLLVFGLALLVVDVIAMRVVFPAVVVHGLVIVPNVVVVVIRIVGAVAVVAASDENRRGQGGGEGENGKSAVECAHVVYLLQARSIRHLPGGWKFGETLNAKG